MKKISWKGVGESKRESERENMQMFGNLNVTLLCPFNSTPNSRLSTTDFPFFFFFQFNHSTVPINFSRSLDHFTNTDQFILGDKVKQLFGAS